MLILTKRERELIEELLDISKKIWEKYEEISLIEGQNVEIPLSIVECGFLSNPQEEQELQQEKYQSRLAWGIYTGICDYFKE